MSSTNTTVHPLSDAKKADWDRFVENHPHSSFFHKADWRDVIESAFSHQTHYLYAMQDNEIVGIVPLVHIKSLLFGNSLISTPCCVYGGILTSTPEAQLALDQAACKLAEKLDVDYLELRNTEQQHTNWPYKDLYSTFKMQIPADEEENILKFRNKQRTVIRKSLRAQLDAHVDETIDDFFTVYSLSVRNLGTPVFSKRYFKILKDTFGDACRVLTVRKNDKVLSSVVSFYFKNEVLPYYGGGIPEATSVKAYDYMYWKLMRDAVEEGYTNFDFGRSKKNTGAYTYKKHWGFEPQQLFYEYYLLKSEKIPELNPLNPKYQLFIKAWKKLPLPVSQVVGPMVAKYLG